MAWQALGQQAQQLGEIRRGDAVDVVQDIKDWLCLPLQGVLGLRAVYRQGLSEDDRLRVSLDPAVHPPPHGGGFSVTHGGHDGGHLAVLRLRQARRQPGTDIYAVNLGYLFHSRTLSHFFRRLAAGGSFSHGARWHCSARLSEDDIVKVVLHNAGGAVELIAHQRLHGLHILCLLLRRHDYTLGRGEGLGKAVVEAPVGLPAPGGEHHQPLAVGKDVTARKHPGIVFQPRLDTVGRMST